MQASERHTSYVQSQDVCFNLRASSLQCKCKLRNASGKQQHISLHCGDVVGQCPAVAYLRFLHEFFYECGMLQVYIVEML